MRILKSAACGLIVSSLLSISIHAFDLKKLTTKHGKVYHDIRIISSDKTGLLFRHSKGIAKESFPSLSDNIREMFQPVGKIPAGKGKGGQKQSKGSIPGKGGIAKRLPTDKGGSDQHHNWGGGKGGDGEELILTLIVRQPVYQQQWFSPAACQLHPNPYNWPVHWHRFHPAHYLTNPVCRAQANRNFLHATGLLPRSCGVRHYNGNTRFAGSNSYAPVRVVTPPIRRFY